MSLYAADAFGYYQQVEAYFLSLSKIGVMLSSKDTELMRHYKSAYIPVEVVCLGIRRAFSVYEEAPRSIYQCRHLIDDEIKAWQARSAGQHAPEPAPESSGGDEPPGRRLRDPNDPRRKPRSRLRRQLRRQQRAPSPPEAPEPTIDEVPPAEREPHMASWYKSMERLIELGKASGDDHVRRAYRWAWRQMHALKQEALDEDDLAHVAHILPLAVGEIEAAMYDQLFNSLHPDLRQELEEELPPQMKKALRGMSPVAARRQMRVWRRRMLEEVLEVTPFFTP